MAELSSDNLELLAELYETDSYAAFRVRRDGRILRLTRIARPYSESAAFRAAFRKDQSVLSNLHHDNILQFVDWGDADGQLYYLTEFPEGAPLSARVDAGQLLSQEEVTDIGWQIASALQCAHNLGVAHGQLTLSSVQVSDTLRIKVAGFGLYRWLAAANGDKVEPWNDLARRDLTALGQILQSLLSAAVPPDSVSDDSQLTTDLSKLITDLTAGKAELTARDVQGRLGDMLLNVSGDSIEMVDHRKGLGLSRRSLVDELFDEPKPAATAAAVNSQPASVSPANVRKRRTMQNVLLFLGAAVVIAVMILFVLSLMTPRPTNLGVTDGKLAAVPSSPNCVSTQAASEVHQIAAFDFVGDPADAMRCLHNIVTAESGATIIEESDDYLYAEFRSRLFRFVDDVEFLVDQQNCQIQFRSASRIGHSDLGVNRQRMEHLRRLFTECSHKTSPAFGG